MTSSQFTPDSTGKIDLSSNPPFSIQNITQISNNIRLPVRNVGTNIAHVRPNVGSITFEITYTPKPTIPVNATDPFVWVVANADNDVLNAYLCVKAARHLKPKENELIQGLELRAAELSNLLGDLYSTQRVQIVPFKSGRSARSPFGYMQTDNATIQIVYVADWY